MWQMAKSSLHDRIAAGFKRRFVTIDEDYPLGGTGFVDFVIPRENKVAIIEVKTGNPDFPLPISTVSQMKEYMEKAHLAFESKAIVPVIVTNYRLSPNQEEKLKDAGVAVLSIGTSNDIDGISAKLSALIDVPAEK